MPSESLTRCLVRNTKRTLLQSNTLSRDILDREQILHNLANRKLDNTTFDRVQTYPVAAVCPTCDGTKIYRLNGQGFDCDCEMQRLLQKHYFAANIGREYHDICAN